MLKFFAVGLLLCIVHIDARSIKILITPEDTEPPGDGVSDYKLELAECLAQLPTTPKSKNLKENDGYKEIKSLGAYKVHHTNLPWKEANETCETEGGHLLFIRAAFEAIKVTEMLKNDRESMFWLGIHQVRVVDDEFNKQLPPWHQPKLRTIWETSLGEDVTHDYSNVGGFSKILVRLAYGYSQFDVDQCGLLFPLMNAEIAAPCIYPAPFICKREPIK